APVLLVARREVADLDHATVGGFEPGHEHRAVAEVALARRDFTFEFEVEPACVGQARREQGTEDRIAVERRQAAPDDAPAWVDQRADAAIADDAEVERRHVGVASCAHAPPSPGIAASSSTSQARTAAGSRKAQRATVGRRAPTMTPVPPSARATTKACSSVWSSPTTHGTR